MKTKNRHKEQSKPAAKQSADDLSTIAPEFTKLTQDVLFGDIWKRPGLSQRDKSLITVTVLATLNRTEERKTMPHVIVKLWPGKSEQQKMRLAEEIVKDVMNVLNHGEESVSVAIEEVPAQDWEEKVYKPDILNNSERLYKKPGYTM